jgi:hypothetical protein
MNSARAKLQPEVSERPLRGQRLLNADEHVIQF